MKLNYNSSLLYATKIARWRLCGGDVVAYKMMMMLKSPSNNRPASLDSSGRTQKGMEGRGVEGRAKLCLSSMNPVVVADKHKLNMQTMVKWPKNLPPPPPSDNNWDNYVI